jgi:hypothetical protein
MLDMGTSVIQRFTIVHVCAEIFIINHCIAHGHSGLLAKIRFTEYFCNTNIAGLGGILFSKLYFIYMYTVLADIKIILCT